MFTGLIEEVGTVGRILSRSGYRQFTIHCRKILPEMKKGDSVAVDGVCQTVISKDAVSFTVETLAMSLKKTTLGKMRKGQAVNLERAMSAESRFDGHIVQGHVESVGRFVSVKKQGINRFLTIRAPRELQSRLIPEGSVTIDGMSLTIAFRSGADLVVNIIPETWLQTALRYKKPGDFVNLETDLLLRSNEYKQKSLNFETLRQWGYGT